MNIEKEDGIYEEANKFYGLPPDTRWPRKPLAAFIQEALSDQKKEIREYLKKKEDDWALGLTYLADEKLDDQFKTAKGHLKIILDDLIKFLDKLKEINMNTKVMFSSKSDEWETPQDLFDKLDEEFHFSLDVCADENNYKVVPFYSKLTDGLTSDWFNYTCWMNPPYGREIGEWVKKASEVKNTVVCLLPARTDTKWFHDYIYKKANVEIRFLKGRLKFGKSKNSAPFPSMIVIFNYPGL